MRSKRPMERKLLNGKSGMALGLFVALFGLNQLFLYDTTTTYIVAIIFILLGGLNAWVGFKTYLHHIPYAVREAEEIARQ